MPPELAPTRPLRDLLRATPRLAPERASTLLANAALAIDRLSGPYGALAPERVLVGRGDIVTLAPAPQPGGPAPWPAYLAPEQIDGRPGDARSDVYALGLLGWEMLAGQQPWEGESLYGIVVKQREQDLPRLSTLRPGLPRRLVQAIEGSLHKAPGDRWQSADEFLAALAPAAGRTPTPTPVFAPPPYGPPRESAPARPGGVRLEPPRPESPRPAPGPPRPPERGFVARGAIPLPPEAQPSDPRDDDAFDDDEAPAARAADPRPRPDARADPRPAPARRGRWLTFAALGLALLAASAGAFAIVQGRQDSSETRAWLDSVTVTGATPAAAAPAGTTRENTTSVPVRRAGGQRSAPDVVELPDSIAPEEPDETEEAAPVIPLEPTPPLVPSPAPRPGRPTVPRPPFDTIRGRDTLTLPPG